MKQVPEIEPVDTDVDFDDIDDSEIDVDLNEDDDVETQEEVSSAHQLPEDIQAMLNSYKTQSQNYVDHRLLKLTKDMKRQNKANEERFTAIEETLEQHAEALKQAIKMPASAQSLTDAVKKMAPKTESSAKQSSAVSNVVDGTLGTVGSVLHGVVDTTAFLLESVVDLITLGKARRTN